MRTIVAADRLMYENMLSKRRDCRVRELVSIWTCAIAIRFLPAWIIDSSVYQNSETIVMRSAASRV